MNNPNPFIPQGSLLEQKNRKRSRFQVAVFTIFAVNVLVITPMLIQGCKRDAAPDATTTTTTSTTPGDSGAPLPAATDISNTATALPPAPAPAPIPAPAPTPVPPAPTAGTEYVIVRGDTLDSIHKKFSVSVKAIEDANPGIVPTKLQPGHKIQIPAAAATAPTISASGATVAADGSELYVVKSGDNLGAIAKTHGTTVKAIQSLNNLKTTMIKVGDKLKMPAPKAAATPPPAATLPAPVAPAPTTTTPTAPAPGNP